MSVEGRIAGNMLDENDANVYSLDASWLRPSWSRVLEV